jgi:hypothetical protein
MAMPAHSRYWFPAKRYGWGWGLPVAWQGWLSLVCFIVLVIAGVLLFPPREALAKYLIYVVSLSIAFAALCWWKGEPPRWRWGEDN